MAQPIGSKGEEMERFGCGVGACLIKSVSMNMQGTSINREFERTNFCDVKRYSETCFFGITKIFSELLHIASLSRGPPHNNNTLF